MADAVSSALVVRLVTIIENHTQFAVEFSEKLLKLKNELVFIQGYLEDASGVKTKDQNKVLKIVTRKLKELLYVAENIIEDCELMYLKQLKKRPFSTHSAFFSPSYLAFRYRQGKKLGQINKELGNLKENMISYLEAAPCSSRSQRPDHYVGGNQSSSPEYLISIMEDDEIVGLEDASEKIMKWILKADESLKVIGIVGKGGIGKSTLAQKVLDDDNMTMIFDHKLFVTISSSIRYEELIKSIMNQLKVERSSVSSDPMVMLQQLQAKLNGKKFLLILDDVWETSTYGGGSAWWESLRSALEAGKYGSCVIVTTRLENVAKSMGVTLDLMHHSSLLSIEDSWSLFGKITFSKKQGRSPTSELESIGKEITQQCGGLPLALKVVAGMMSRKPYLVDEWIRIREHLNQELKDPNEDEQLFTQLQLCYDELPLHLKPCILSFSLFPEDREFCSDFIVCWWIGEGFIQERNGKTAFEVGTECFEELRSRCLLLPMKGSIKETFYVCKVHDLFREMLIGVAVEENFMARRRIIMTNGDEEHFGGKNLKLLRTLIIEGRRETKEFVSRVAAKFGLLSRLRVLHISFRKNENEIIPKVWLVGIATLLHLRSLIIENSSMIESLPDFMGSLPNLQILRVRNCENFRLLPNQVKSFVNLKILDAQDNILPMDIESLSKLEFLAFCPGKSSFRTSDVKKLAKLTTLVINIKSKVQIDEEDLKVLSNLENLKMLAFESSDSELHAREIDCAWTPLKQLQVLRVSIFAKKVPTWLNPTTFPGLQFLAINGERFYADESGLLWEKLEKYIMKNVEAEEEERSEMEPEEEERSEIV